MTNSPRIVTVSLNAAIDQTVTVPGFRLDSVNRVDTSRVDAGGKGVNVACFLAHAGHTVAVTGVLGRDNDALFTRHLAAVGVTDACIRVHGATRTNVKIIDPQGGRITDLNFPGPIVSERDLDAVRATLETLAAEGLDWLVLSGSLPTGVPATIYADLIAWGRARGARVALDTSGAALAASLPAGPDLIKPNRAELEALTGTPLPDLPAVAEAAGRLVSAGVGLVVVSLGAEGAVLCDHERTLLAVPPKMPVVSTVGAGDAMVAGLVHAATRALPLAEAAQLATGFSLGALGKVGPRLPSLTRIKTLARETRVMALGVPVTVPRQTRAALDNATQGSIPSSGQRFLGRP